MRDLSYSIRVGGGFCRLSAGVSASNGCYMHIDGGPRESAHVRLSRAELRAVAEACLSMLEEQEGPVMDGWDLKAEGTLARLDVRSGGELVSLPMSSKSLSLLGRAVSSLLKSAASEQPTALDAVDMRGPSAYCPGANGHTCDGGRLVECDEHGETDAGPCPHCNPQPPQTYRDRIAELERDLREARHEASRERELTTEKVDMVRDLGSDLVGARRELADMIKRHDKEAQVLKHTIATERAALMRTQADLDALRKTLETERQAAVATAEELERYRTGHEHVLRSEGDASTAMLAELESRRETMHAIIMELPSDVLQDDERTLAERVRDLRKSREQMAEELERKASIIAEAWAEIPLSIQTAPYLGLAARVAALRAERDDERAWNFRRRETYDRIGKALEPFREKRSTGEPARNDATEVEAVCRELTALRDRYRPRRQEDEKAPSDVANVLYWNGSKWGWARPGRLHDDDIWTHQPPAPGEGE